MKKQEIQELEERDAAGYSRTPAQSSEIDEWQGEQVWIEGEELTHHDKASRHEVTASGRTNVIEEGLKRAAGIRLNLEGRDHSDSTKDVIEDRQR